MAAAIVGLPGGDATSGRLSVRTIDAAQLYSDPRHALAVTDAGTLLDLEHEQQAVMPVAWRSHPVPLDALMAQRVRRVVWHVRGDDVDVALRLTGQRGIMGQEQDVSLVAVNGAVDQPLATPAVAVPARTVTLAMDGTASSGTLLLPTVIYIGKLD